MHDVIFFDIYHDSRTILDDEKKDTSLKAIYYIKGLTHKIDELKADLEKKEKIEKKKIISELLDTLINEDAIISDEAKLDALNRLMLVLGLEPFSKEFYDILFGKNFKFSDPDRIKKVTHKFRCLCLLKHGRFRGGYRKFVKNPEQLRASMKEFFPDDDTIQERMRHYSSPQRIIVGFKEIPEELRFCLGYLARKEFPDVKENRILLKQILEKAIHNNIKNYEELCKSLATFSGNKITESKQFEELIHKTAIPNAVEKIVYHQIFHSRKPYVSLLSEIIQLCEIEDDRTIEDVRTKGKENTYAYLSCKNIDIYFATSMRTREDFVLNSKFISNLMQHRDLHGLKLLYFDPTQSYVDDRIQKGLVECIMIRRAKITVYNAQDKETFGKVAEATLTLAYGKPVIIYVPRILHDYPDETLQEIYTLLDNSIYYTHTELLNELKERGLISEEDYFELQSPEKEKVDIIDKLADKFEECLQNIDLNEINKNLLEIGLHNPNGLGIEFAKKKFKQFEKSALLFRELHPLAFQISPVDGVARGVFVARSVDQVAKLIKGLLITGLEYDIKKVGNNVILTDKITNSPIRVAPDESAIRIAFAIETDSNDR